MRRFVPLGIRKKPTFSLSIGAVLLFSRRFSDSSLISCFSKKRTPKAIEFAAGNGTRSMILILSSA